jgi:competence protein ComEA
MATGARRSLWGWSVPVRRLLAASAVAPALVLLLLGVPAGEPAAAVAPALVVDANTAPPQVITALPRIGPVLAGRIVAARRERPFRSLADLDARVRGIGPATAAALGPFLRFPEQP